MKAWRKHNSTSYVRNHPKMRITKSERRNFFVAETTPIASNLLFAMFRRIGLPVPSITT